MIAFIRSFLAVMATLIGFESLADVLDINIAGADPLADETLDNPNGWGSM